METNVFKTDAEFVLQLNTTSSKIDDHSADLNMDAADVDSLKADAKYCQWVLTVSDSVETYSQAMNKFKDILFGKIKGQPLGTFPAVPVRTGQKLCSIILMEKKWGGMIAVPIAIWRAQHKN
jgi:hypothetical protein